MTKELCDEITRLRADLAAVTEERDYVMAESLYSADQIRILETERDAAIAELDAAKRSAYEDAARFIEENVFNYSSTENNYWSKRKGGDSNGLEYAREFREKAAAIRSRK